MEPRFPHCRIISCTPSLDHAKPPPGERTEFRDVPSLLRQPIGIPNNDGGQHAHGNKGHVLGRGEIHHAFTSQVPLVKRCEIARATSSQSCDEQQEDHHKNSADQQQGVQVHIPVRSLDAFEHIGRSVAVVVHVFGQPAREAVRAVKDVGLSVAVGVNLSARVERERILCIAETVVVVVFVVDVGPARFARVGVKPRRWTNTKWTSRCRCPAGCTRNPWTPWLLLRTNRPP